MKEKSYVSTGSCQETQLAAALEVAEKTPQKIRLVSAGNRRVGESGSATRLETAKKAVFDDPAVAAIGCYHLDVKAGKNYDPHQQEHGMDNTWEDPKPTSGSKKSCTKDSAFQKMLQKLRNGPPSEAKQASEQSKDPNNSDNYGSQWDYGRKKIRSKVLRDANRSSTDSGVDSRPLKQYREKELSHDSGVSVSRKSKPATLNPRAREFLSFDKPRSSTDEGVQPQGAQQLSVDELFDPATQNATIHREDPVLTTYGLYPSTTINPPLDVPLSQILSGAFPGNGQFTSIGTLPGPLPTAGILPPLNLGINPNASFIPNLVATSNFVSPGSLPQPFAPVQGMPLGPFSAPPPAFVAPPNVLPQTAPKQWYNVPKPRKPDPQDQQTYEAWIEWRKANEPGYAIECKLRQQRRAQRRSATGSKESQDSASIATVSAKK